MNRQELRLGLTLAPWLDADTAPLSDQPSAAVLIPESIMR